MLLQLREYIRQHGTVSTQQLGRAFHIDSQALSPMLAVWVKKGVIAQCQEKNSCQSACFKCKNSVEYYRFLV